MSEHGLSPFNADHRLLRLLVDAGLDETIDAPRYVDLLNAIGITTVEALHSKGEAGLRDAGITLPLHIRAILKAAAPSEKRAASPSDQRMLLKPMPFDAMEELALAQDERDVDGVTRVLQRAVNANVAAKACEAVSYVCDYGGPRTTMFGASGACELVVDVFKRWGAASEEAARMACYAVGELAYDSPSNCERLLACGACELVVDALTRWGAGSDDAARGGCYAVYRFARDSPALKSRLLRAGAVEAVTAARENYFKAQALAALA